MSYQARRTSPRTTVNYNRPSVMAHRPPVRPMSPPHRNGLGGLGDTSPFLFNVGSFPVTVDTATYALLGLAAIILVPVFVGPKSARGRRRRIYRAASSAASGSTLGTLLPWTLLLAGGAYFIGSQQQAHL